MSIQNIGKSFLNKSGKSTTIVLSANDLDFLKANMQEHEKYGKQVRLIATNSQYGVSIGFITDETPEKENVASKQTEQIKPKDLPF